MTENLHNNRKYAIASCRTTTGKRIKQKKPGSVSAVSRRARFVNSSPNTDCTEHTVPTVLASAVCSALKVSRQQPYCYLLTATLMSAGAIAQAQGLPALISIQDLDGSNGFVINGGGDAVSDAGDINGDGVDDVIIGASFAGPGGQSYVVFGSVGVGSSGSLDSSSLDGINGFAVNSLDRYADFGGSVSGAGDINGDGVDDVIIGARNAEANGVSSGGESYVVFGGAGTSNSGSLDISSLDGVNGFVINGINENDDSGFSVSGAGDVNGDGVDDVIIGAPFADPNGVNASGQSYILFGGSDVGSGGSLNLTTLNGINGFVFNGVNRYDRSGFSVSGAGDINGDGVDDLIVGARSNGVAGVAENYVVFGGSDIGNSGSLNPSDLDGINGFVINGAEVLERTGYSVSAAGDVNGDGVDDVIIGAPMADANGADSAGESYVVFGSSDIGFGGSLNLSALNGVNGFVINGIIATDQTGISVSGAGDINGDGMADVIIGSSFIAYEYNRRAFPPDTYVVFGGTDVGIGGSLDLSTLDGVNGFVVRGINLGDQFGESVSGAGDINGDGLDDIIIGDNRGGASYGGASYVVFGVSDTPITLPPEGPDPMAPENDQFENARYLDNADKALVSGLTLTVKGTNVGATVQNDEPAHFVGGFGLPPGPDNSIWYRWTPDADQVVEVDTAGSAVSTVLVAYTGATVSGLQEIARGIDNVREVARFRFAARAGETYHFAIDGYEEISEGNIQLNLRQPRLDPSECTIKGTNGSDSLVGTPGPDVICALDGDDFIKALGGDDIIFAGKGSDFISADGDNDIVFGEEGNDVISGASGNDVLIGGPGNDQLAGADGNDAVFGGTGADRLSGSGGNDELFGESDEDRLIGGSGNDYLDGGSSEDICVDSEGEDTLVSC